MVGESHRAGFFCRSGLQGAVSGNGVLLNYYLKSIGCEIGMVTALLALSSFSDAFFPHNRIHGGKSTEPDLGAVSASGAHLSRRAAGFASAGLQVVPGCAVASPAGGGKADRKAGRSGCAVVRVAV